MSKAEEILSQFDVLYYDNFDLYVYSKEDVLKAMEAYGMACLEKAADMATVIKIAPEGYTDGIQTGFTVNGFTYEVDKESINSKINLA